MPTRFPISATFLVGVALVAGCSDTSTPNASSVAASVPVAATTIAPSAKPIPATSTALPDDHATTHRYRIAITYPPLPADQAALEQALRNSGNAAKREFMHALPDPKKFPEFADRQLQLLIDYTIAARTPAFVSVREKGMSDTGGAHPLPIDAAFVYSVHADKLITLDDLFTDPVAARKRLGEMARKSLHAKFMKHAPDSGEGTPQARREWSANMQRMLDDGTQPTSGNFSQFIVSNDVHGAPGLTLIFPPYQVAPYVFGTQTVDIPLSDFVHLLKPRFRDDFAAIAATQPAAAQSVMPGPDHP